MKSSPDLRAAGPGRPAQLPAQQPREAASIWMSGVVAPFAQNVIGGIGVAVIAGLLGMALWPENGVLVGKARPSPGRSCSAAPAPSGRSGMRSAWSWPPTPRAAWTLRPRRCGRRIAGCWPKSSG